MPENYIEEYWDRIQAGEIIVCRKIQQQYQKLIDDLKKPRRPWLFDIEAATRPITFKETFCRNSKGRWIGQPLRLMLWQKAKDQAIYGFVHEETGLRRCRETLTIVGRKNGKSTDKAAGGLYMTVGDGEGGAEVYSLATKRDQARIVWTEAYNMTTQSPELAKHIKKRKTDLYFPATFSIFAPLSSEDQTLDGLNTHYGVIDELQAITNRNLYDVIKQSMSAREQALLDIITTAGYVREGIFDEMYDYAEEVLDGTIEDDRFLAFIYELDSRDEWTNPEMWIKANPGLDVVKSRDELAANVELAKNRPNFLSTVLTKDFNVRETVAGSWLTYEQANNPATYEMEEIRDSYGIGGNDLGATTDLTWANIILMKPGSETIYVVGQAFMPEHNIIERSQEDKVPYDKWAERGFIILSKGHKVDYRDVTDWYIRMREEFGIIAYWNGYDSWNSPAWVEDMETRLGYRNKQDLLPVIMGAKTLSAPMKELEADLAGKLVNYNNNPVLKWALTNVSTETDKNENIRPIKAEKGVKKRKRIDPAVGLIIARTVMSWKMADYKGLIGW
jgi:phage terminase large subunit-like protein